MPLTIPYQPDNSLDVDRQPKVHIVQFGDGEEQRRAAGLNNMLGKWNVTYDMKEAYIIEAVDAFLIARKGVEPFYFTSYDGVVRLVVCETHSKRYPYGTGMFGNITARLREVVR